MDSTDTAINQEIHKERRDANANEELRVLLDKVRSLLEAAKTDNEQAVLVVQPHIEALEQQLKLKREEKTPRFLEVSAKGLRDCCAVRERK